MRDADWLEESVAVRLSVPGLDALSAGPKSVRCHGERRAGNFAGRSAARADTDVTNATGARRMLMYRFMACGEALSEFRGTTAEEKTFWNSLDQIGIAWLPPWLNRLSARSIALNCGRRKS